MKKTLSLFLLIFGTICSYSQTTAALAPLPPTNIIATANQIRGNADTKSTIKIKVGNNEYKTFVNYKGYFEFTFEPAIPSAIQKISIWTIDEAGNEKSYPDVPIESSDIILAKLSKGEIKIPSNTAPAEVAPAKKNYITPEIDEKQPESTTYKYNVSMLNTNFTIPIVRFNLAGNEDKTTTKDGDIQLFNSIGAGIGLSYGKLEKTTDAKGEVINNEFTSSLGVHLGFLFSAGSTTTENKNVFAPTLSVSILDFQFGYGLEMGNRAPNQKRDFFTIAYAIPISKLIKSKYFVIAATKGYNTTNPLPKIKVKKKVKDGKKKVEVEVEETDNTLQFKKTFID